MIYQAEKKDIGKAAELAAMLWNSHSPSELTGDLTRIADGKEGVIFLAEADGQAVGFAQCQLRHDYVEGTESSPVGYLEGIFVRQAYRKQGYAARLLQACEDWAREKGCKEFASDCELSNDASLAFHLNVGFTEANRIICFCKNIEQ